MKKLLMILAVSVTAFTNSATAQLTSNSKSEVFQVGNSTDVAHGNSTLSQKSPVQAGGGVTVQYWLDQTNDSCAGYASVWGSIDGITYAPYPGADSVAITVGVDIKKLWFLSTFSNKNPVKFIDVRTRLTTSYTVGRANAKTKVYTY